MYSHIFILVIFACASKATEGLGRCIFGFDESRCEPHELRVSYNLFTNENGDFRQLNTRDLSQCPDPNIPVKIIVHGWHSSASKKWIKDMNQAYFRKGNYNVIALDWSEPAKKFYFAAAVNTLCIGNIAGEFILNYLGQCGINPKNIHIIGHSLGAHVAGFIGKYVAKNTQTRIARISGLDMAGLCFDGSTNRLYRGDAQIVEVYHTDDILGSTTDVGDFDIYFNGGLLPQPGCLDIKSDANIDQFLKGIFTCSHQRSHEYYLESINSNGFRAIKCERISSEELEITGSNAIIIGENLSTNSPRGSYYLETNSEPPYALSA